MHLSQEERGAKLAAIVESEGFGSLEELLEAAAYDSVAPGICCRPGCTYTVEVEPDQDRGFCEECRTQSVRSALILAGLI